MDERQSPNHLRGLIQSPPLQNSIQNATDGINETMNTNNSTAINSNRNPAFHGQLNIPRQNSRNEADTITRTHPILQRDIPTILPHDKVFNVQVGSQIFPLSGASICSDAPSYFSYYFMKQIEELKGDDRNVKTLHIDRDPEIFRDIARHLQGYHIQIRDPQHFVYLFADAQLFQLPKLISRLFESEIFVTIGAQHFQIPRDIFNSAGNTPNYFTLGFAYFFTSPQEVFPGLDPEGLLRPPAIAPPIVPNKSPTVFAELLHMLRGYPCKIRSSEHRAELIRDCRYYHLRGLEQKLIPHEISYNLARQTSEIMIRLEDVKPSGIIITLESLQNQYCNRAVSYMRPFQEDGERELLIEIGNNHTIVDHKSGTADFVGDTKRRINALFQIIRSKLNLPRRNDLTPSSGDSSHITTPNFVPEQQQQKTPSSTPNDEKVKVLIDHQSYITLDSKPYHYNVENTYMSNMNDNPFTEHDPVSNLLGNTETNSYYTDETSVYGIAGTHINNRMAQNSTWFVHKGIWRIIVQGDFDTKIGIDILLQAVKLEATSNEHGRNMARSFLS